MVSVCTTTSRIIQQPYWRHFAPYANGIATRGYGRCSNHDRKPAGAGFLSRHLLSRLILRTKQLSLASLVQVRSSPRTRFPPIVLSKAFVEGKRTHSRSDRRMKSLIFLVASWEVATKSSSCQTVDSTTFTTSFWTGFGKAAHENSAVDLLHHV